jgi:hypothetical protein
VHRAADHAAAWLADLAASAVPVSELLTAALAPDHLERGRASGELRADLDCEAAAWWLLSLVAAQKFRRATAVDPADVEARLARSALAFLTE